VSAHPADPTGERRRLTRLLVGVAAAGATAALAFLVWAGPRWQLEVWRPFLTGAALLRAENEMRTTILLALGLVALIAATWLLWRRTLAAERSAAAALQMVAAAQESRRNERFGRAVEQLASERVEVRLGGIYVLERLARESAEEHAAIVQVLGSFVRERAAWSEDAPRRESPPGDVQAVLTVLGRLPHAPGVAADLRRCDLRGADLRGADLRAACLAEAHLENAKLQGVNLEHADLRAAHLVAADLVEARMKGAVLREARLEQAYLVEAHLEGADLGGAHLEGAYLGGADLEGADLGGAHLDGAYIYKARLSGASLHGARIMSAIGMNREQREEINRTASVDPLHRVRPRGGSPEDGEEDLLPPDDELVPGDLPYRRRG
jgi:Pentapeptide repeats (8 copies)